MKSLTIFLLFIVTVSLVNLNLLGRWFIDEPLESGKTEILYFNLRNDANTGLDDVNVKLYIWDLGLMYKSTISTDIQKGDNVVERMFVNIPGDVPPGEYDVVIIAGNDRFRDREHISLKII